MRAPALLALAVAAVAQAQAPVPCPPAALTEAQVLRLVKDRVPDGRIVQFVDTCRVRDVTQEMLGRLRAGGAPEAVVAAVRSQRQLTLDQARQEVASLELRIRNLATAAAAARDGDLARLEADYQRERDKTAQVGPQDMFEKDADYAARVAKAKDALADLERVHKANREQLAARYSGELAEQTQAIRRQIEAFVKERKYLLAGAKLEFVNYDANHDRLVAEVNGEQYWFTAPPDRAKIIYGRWSKAALAQAFSDDDSHTRYLVDAPTGERFPGVPKAVGEEIERKEAVGEFVAIPAGEFMMGSSSLDERPRHRVRITKGFEMGKYEVTQAQWKALMGANPSTFKQDDCPVETVSWNDVQEFLKRLNAMNDGYRYRLPTEAEWEYAARAGSAADTVADLDAVAWYSGNSGSETHPVGRKRANAWGLYDMLGNVWEWCADWYDASYYASSPVDDPQRPASGSMHVVRGGSWLSVPVDVRPSDRVRGVPGVRIHDFGFRLVREAILP